MADEPIGTSAPAASGGAPAAPTSGAPAEPSVVEMGDDTLIKVKGQDKPVKFSEYGRGFQAQFTKASQKAAELQKALQARDAELQQLKAAAARQPQTQAQPQNDVFAALKALPYLSGNDAAEMVQTIGKEIQ